MNPRPIKFRAWDKRKAIMRYIEPIQLIHLRSSGCYFADGFIDDGDYLFPESYIPMQFTGCLDKNSREIYEGDIVKTKVSIGEVYWHQPSCSFANVFGDECEVIGNVWENPELLK